MDRDRLKTYIIIFLIFLSIFQLGVLWGNQSHGLPFKFISAWFGIFNNNPNGDVDDSDIIDYYFRPFRISVSDGRGRHWQMPAAGGSYDELWDDAKYYLDSALRVKPHLVDSADGWGSVVLKRSFKFDFKSDLPAELIGWFFSIRELPPNGPVSVQKFVIGPFDADTGCRVTILGGGMIYSYLVPYKKGRMDGDLFDLMIEEFEKSGDDKYKAFSVVNELNPGSFPFKIQPDILCAIKGSKYMDFNTLDYSVPDSIGGSLEEVAEDLLGGGKESLDRSVDVDDNMVFTGIDNSYRLYKDGYLEYRYVPGAAGAEPGNIGDAFVNAARFVMRVRQSFIPSASIYLSGVQKTDEKYKFTFDYMEGGLPVLTEYKPAGAGGMQLNNAIYAESNSKRLLKCNWVMRDIYLNRDAGAYNVNFEDLLGNMKKKYEALDIKLLDIQDMFASYLLDSATGKKLRPVWVIEDSGNKRYFVPLAAKPAGK